MLGRTDHHWVDIPEFEGSYALLSDSEPVDTAVLFVHGFMGHPIGTWANFQGLADLLQESLPWWRTCDVYFFSYRSATNAITVSAELCGRFVDWFYPSPPSSLFWIEAQSLAKWGIASDTPLELRETRPYQRLVLVAHSEGAVVIRKLILDRVRRHDQTLRHHSGPLARANDVVPRFLSSGAAAPAPAMATDHILGAQLRLFAPATFGASISGIPGALMCMPGVGTVVRTIVESFTAYKDLDSRGGYLQELRQSTTAFPEQYPISLP